MADRAASAPPEPPPPGPPASFGGGPSSLVDVFTAGVPAGIVESPLDTHHVVDVHVGAPVHVACQIDSRERRGVQSHGVFNVVPAGVIGRWRMPEEARALILRLPPRLLDETADAMGLPPRAAEIRPAIHMRDPQIERLGWVLKAELDDDYPSGQLFLDSLATALAARLVALQGRGDGEDRPAARALPAWRLRNVLDYIEHHLDKDLGLDELATVAGFSLSHFKSLFKQSVGVPVHRYVLDRRVERARKLLQGGTRSITEVALEAGFSHPSHMARCMRRVLGVSPSQIAGSPPTAGAPRRR